MLFVADNLRLRKYTLMLFNFWAHRSVSRKFSLKPISLDNKVVLMRDLTARHIAVLIFDLTVKEFVGSLTVVEKLGDRCRDMPTIAPELETEGYSAKKKFILVERKIALQADEEIIKIDNIIRLLASRPDWLSTIELKEILEDLRPIIGTFFSSMELLRVVGAPYLDGRDALKEFSRNNKILDYSADVKSAAGLLSADIKKNLHYLSAVLKEVQRKWGWLSDEEKEATIARLRKISDEKKKIAKERKKERKRQDKIAKDYLKSFRKPFKNFK